MSQDWKIRPSEYGYAAYILSLYLAGHKKEHRKFYILLAVHLGTILANNQLVALL